MGFKIYPKNYAEYLRRAYEKIHSEKEYLTALDAATGDGDHWANLDQGFSKLAEEAPALAQLTLAELFQSAANTMMTVIGGSSGVLYASAYLEAGKTLQGKEYMDSEGLCDVLAAMLAGIMARGKAAPGMKTMVDTLDAAVCRYRDCLEGHMDERELLDRVRAAALEGQNSTMQMEAVRGRACYRPDRGVGNLDPGAVSMYQQIETLVEEIKSSCFQ